MSNKIILGSLALDLKRVAIGYHRGSIKMGDRFYHEALSRIEEIDICSVKPYLRKQLVNVGKLAERKDLKHRAEDALMYSILIQNYCLKYC